MWCHLCTKDYADFEEFRIHIIKMHRNSSEFCEESSESEEESEHKSDDSTAALNASPKQFSENEENKSDDGTAALNNLPKECYDDGNKSDDSTTDLPKQCSDSDEKKSHATPVLNILPRRHKKVNTADAINSVLKKLPRKRKTSSILRKRVQTKKKKKVVFSKNILRKHEKPLSLHQEGSSEHSEDNETDHSESSVRDNAHIVSQTVLNNYANSQSLLNNNCVNSQSAPANNYVNSHPVVTNNPVFLVNPYANQGTNNYVMGNQAQPFYVVNPVTSNPTSSKAEKCFNFSSKNILKWLTRHKILCKNMKYPLPQSLFNQIKVVHKGIFDHYCTASISEETDAVMKVYEELDCMIHKHINSINNSLSVL